MSPSQITAAQQTLYDGKAKASTGRSCAPFTMFSSLTGSTAAIFKTGVDGMVKFQGQQGIKTIKKQQVGTSFQQQL